MCSGALGLNVANLKYVPRSSRNHVSIFIIYAIWIVKFATLRPLLEEAGVTPSNIKSHKCLLAYLFTVLSFPLKGLDHGFSHLIELMIIDGKRLRNPLRQKWDLVN